MKYLLFPFLFYCFLVPAQYHAAEVSTGIFINQFDAFNKEYSMRSYSPGLSLKVKHYLDYPGFKWIGTNIELNKTMYEPLNFNLGLAVRHSVFNDFLELELLAPILNMNLSGNEAGQYNTPFGFAVHIFSGKVKLSIRELFFKNGINTRLSFRYGIGKI